MNNKLTIAIAIIVTLICMAWGGAKLQECKIVNLGIKLPGIKGECKF